MRTAWDCVQTRQNLLICYTDNFRCFANRIILCRICKNDVTISQIARGRKLLDISIGFNTRDGYVSDIYGCAILNKDIPVMDVTNSVNIIRKIVS